jgi:putative transposase
MARLLTGYAVTFNKRYHRHGPLFQNRYKSILCQEDAYLTELVCYIHLNPLRARMVKDIRDLSRYPYTGHAALMGKVVHPWLDTDYVLRQFSATRERARRQYIAFLESRRVKGKRPDLTGGGLLRSYGSWAEVKKSDTRHKGDQRIFGNSVFVERILEGERLARPVSARLAGLTLDSLAYRVNDLLHVPLDALRSGSRRAPVVEARSLFCFWAVRHGGFPAARVAAFLDMTPPAIGYAVERGKVIARERGYDE